MGTKFIPEDAIVENTEESQESSQHLHYIVNLRGTTHVLTSLVCEQAGHKFNIFQTPLPLKSFQTLSTTLNLNANLRKY